MSDAGATELVEWSGMAPPLRGRGPRPRFLVIAAFDGFPGDAADHATLSEAPDDVLTGASILAAAAGADRAVVLVAPADALALERRRSSQPDVRVMTAPPLHPLSSPRVLAAWLADHTAFDGATAADFAIHGAGEAVAVAYAARGRTRLERWVTVAGAVRSPGTFLVPQGTTVSTLLRLAGGRSTEAAQPWQAGREGLAPAALSHGIRPHDSAVLALSGDASLARNAALSMTDALRRINSVCTRCSLCDHACPVGLDPSSGFRGPLAGLDSVRWGSVTDGPALPRGLAQCVDCRICDTVCPTGLPVGRVAGELARQLRRGGAEPRDVRSPRLIPAEAMRRRLGLGPTPSASRDARPEVGRVRLAVSRTSLLRKPGELVWRGDVLARPAGDGGRVLAPITGRLRWSDGVVTIRRDRSSE